MMSTSTIAVLFAFGVGLITNNGLLVVITGIILLFKGWIWLCRRHPMAAAIIFGIFRGLSGGRGGRW